MILRESEFHVEDTVADVCELLITLANNKGKQSHQKRKRREKEKEKKKERRQEQRQVLSFSFSSYELVANIIK